MPGLSRDDHVERSAGWVPVSKVVTSTSSPLCRESSAIRSSGSTPSTRQPASAELAGGDAGSAADIDQIAAGTGVEEVPHHGVWVARPGPFVAIGVRPEGSATSQA